MEPLPGFAAFARLVQQLIGLDLTAYNPRQLYRRLRGQLERVGCRSLEEYGLLLRRSPEQVEALRDFLTINVSEFFRNAPFWRTLADRILPELLAAGNTRIWSAGCSIGAEPYSLAILLEEAMAPATAHIIATDVDEKALAEARTAIYPSSLLHEVSPARLQRFFTPAGPDRWQVKEEVRRRVQLRRHDLLQDPYPIGLNLIVCRNVIIYFNEEAKQRVYRRLAQSLRPGGILFVGATEAILSPAQFGLSPAGPFFYRRDARPTGSS
ncbi:MAG: protein-glutamate O-methyltransferase CheR [Limnochordaceae bacterium]|nr:protein-glutamate O-methyltransferase CheR [Limnochordaceae bacterium]